jgi:hypothetical protein
LNGASAPACFIARALARVQNNLSHMQKLRSPATWLLLLYLSLSTVYVGYRGFGIAWHGLREEETDFRVFYISAEVVLSDHRSRLYDYKRDRELPDDYYVAVGDFFNPPLLAVLFSLFLPFPLLTAKALFVGILVVAALGCVWLCRRWAVTRRDFILMVLATFSFWPLFNSMHVGQPSMLFALASLLGFIALEGQAYGRAGVWWGLLALKPSIAPAYFGIAALFGKARMFYTLALVSGSAILVPFLVLGASALRDYLNLLALSREDAFTLLGGITAGAAYMFNWNGFIARLTLSAPDPLLVAPLYLLTVLLMLRVWATGRLGESWLAGVIALNLATPHIIYYDPVLLLPPAFALALQRRQAPLVALMALVHLGMNVSMFQIYGGALEFGHKYGYMFFMATPAMFLLLAYLAFEDDIERLRRRNRLKVAPAV